MYKRQLYQYIDLRSVLKHAKSWLPVCDIWHMHICQFRDGSSTVDFIMATANLRLDSVHCLTVSLNEVQNMNRFSSTVRRRNLAWFRHVSRQDGLSKTILQGNLGGWAMPRSAEEMLDGQQQRVDISAHAGAAHKGLLQKRLEGDLC